MFGKTFAVMFAKTFAVMFAETFAVMFVKNFALVLVKLFALLFARTFALAFAKALAVVSAEIFVMFCNFFKTFCSESFCFVVPVMFWRDTYGPPYYLLFEQEIQILPKLAVSKVAMQCTNMTFTSTICKTCQMKKF